MKTLKRWTASIATSFDWVISQVENHEALVNGAMREMQQAAAKAKGQLARVRRDGSAMRERLTELQKAQKLWEERAISIHESDRDKALECIRRKKRAETEITALERHIEEHGRIEKQLAQDMEAIHSRIAELKRKKNAFAARQYRAEAMQAGPSEDIGLITEIDEIFDRWDSKLAQCEPYESGADSFEEEFVQEEEQQDLQAELEELLGSNS